LGVWGSRFDLVSLADSALRGRPIRRWPAPAVDAIESAAAVARACRPQVGRRNAGPRLTVQTGIASPDVWERQGQR